MHKLLVATGNPGKMQEMKALLARSQEVSGSVRGGTLLVQNRREMDQNDVNSGGLGGSWRLRAKKKNRCKSLTHSGLLSRGDRI